ncbi:MAG: hypothetical protein IJB82_03215 [Bacilli bacterium]|nr:hypothetical protein [Bacilli bacterium]
MKKIFVALVIFFSFIISLNADSKYIRVGCKECKSNCYVKSGKIFKESEIDNKEDYNSINVPSNFTVYEGSKKISRKIYYDKDEELLFGCKNSTTKTDEDEGNLNIKIGDELTCEELLTDNAKLFVKYAIVFIRIISPILMIVLSSFDFMKAISSKDDDELKKAFKRLETRGIILVLIMLLPTIINILSRLFGVFDSCSIW